DNPEKVISLSRKNMEGRESRKASFPARTCRDGCTYLQGRLHVLEGKNAVLRDFERKQAYDR
ncbi:MAG: hypothetical protein SO414_03420, partial [Bacteroidaceae bacterium]|nr:hypothetical protein [Bacteroidaceae bacterium]